jgi:hypothetical protein
VRDLSIFAKLLSVLALLNLAISSFLVITAWFVISKDSCLEREGYTFEHVAVEVVDGSTERLLRGIKRGRVLVEGRDGHGLPSDLIHGKLGRLCAWRRETERALARVALLANPLGQIAHLRQDISSRTAEDAKQLTSSSSRSTDDSSSLHAACIPVSFSFGGAGGLELAASAFGAAPSVKGDGARAGAAAGFAGAELKNEGGGVVASFLGATPSEKGDTEGAGTAAGVAGREPKSEGDGIANGVVGGEGFALPFAAAVEAGALPNIEEVGAGSVPNGLAAGGGFDVPGKAEVPVGVLAGGNSDGALGKADGFDAVAEAGDCASCSASPPLTAKLARGELRIGLAPVAVREAKPGGFGRGIPDGLCTRAGFAGGSGAGVPGGVLLARDFVSAGGVAGEAALDIVGVGEAEAEGRCGGS